MSETIGNAITDDKNLVKMVTADTLAVLEGSADGVVSSLVPITASWNNDKFNVGFACVIKKDDKFYYCYVVAGATSSPDLDSIKCVTGEITLPTA